MECNRDEAARAKEIAEKKFESKDYHGAKKFALKAQSLYPGLDGIQHMLASLNVYILSEERVDGERDWYRILDVNPSADEETIKKQYRKLALVLHPDKNKSIGADGAFKLISEAWTFLSDKVKRSIFDQKRSIKVANSKASGVNSSNKSTATPKRSVPKPRASKKESSTSNGTSTTTPTFWTVCHRCRVQHEYLRIYRQKNILCPGCNSPFYAYEYPAPSSKLPKIATRTNHFEQNHAQFMPCSNPFQHSQAPFMPYTNLFEQNQAQFMPWFSGSFPANQMNTQWNPFSKTDNQATTVAQEAFEKSKREREEVLNAIRRESQDREVELKRKMEKVSDSNEAKRRKVDEDPVGKKPQGAKMD